MLHRRPVAAAHLQQRAHHDADHVLQKAGAMEGEYHPVLPALNGDVVHQTDGGLLHPRIAAEAGEVVFTQQIGRRLTHFLHIRVVVQQGNVLPVKHRLHRTGVAGVAVGLAPVSYTHRNWISLKPRAAASRASSTLYCHTVRL